MKLLKIKQFFLRYKKIILIESIIILLNIIVLFLYKIDLMNGMIHFSLIGISMLIFLKMTKYYKLKILNIHFIKYKEEKLRMGLNPTLRDFYREYEYYANCWNYSVDKHCKENVKYDDSYSRDFRHKANICSLFIFLNFFLISAWMVVLLFLYKTNQ